MKLSVTLYTRNDCTLCDETKALLDELRGEFPHQLTEVNIDESPALQELYGDLVPVVETGPYEFSAPIDEKTLRMYLGAARDKLTHLTERQLKYQKTRMDRKNAFNRGDRIGLWFSKHYILVVNLFLFLYVGLPFLAPVLMNAGMTNAARPIYSVYSLTCHQLGFRSWFLFGEQAAYPREAAGVPGLSTYGEATGQSEDDLLAARRFLGNEQVGYKVAYCERDVAIYASMFLFGLVWAIGRKRIPALPFIAWIVIGMGPIGLDGFSQLLSQIPGWQFWEYRESTPFLRTLTGAIFGLTTAWFGFPVLQETFEETRIGLEKKLAWIQAKGEPVDS
jgi:uncharacterized membrane protein/glutaredoxin